MLVLYGFKFYSLLMSYHVLSNYHLELLAFSASSLDSSSFAAAYTLVEFSRCVFVSGFSRGLRRTLRVTFHGQKTGAFLGLRLLRKMQGW